VKVLLGLSTAKILRNDALGRSLADRRFLFHLINQRILIALHLYKYRFIMKHFVECTDRNQVRYRDGYVSTTGAFLLVVFLSGLIVHRCNKHV